MEAIRAVHGYRVRSLFIGHGPVRCRHARYETTVAAGPAVTEPGTGFNADTRTRSCSSSCSITYAITNAETHPISISQTESDPYTNPVARSYTFPLTIPVAFAESVTLSDSEPRTEFSAQCHRQFPRRVFERLRTRRWKSITAHAATCATDNTDARIDIHEASGRDSRKSRKGARRFRHHAVVGECGHDSVRGIRAR